MVGTGRSGDPATIRALRLFGKSVLLDGRNLLLVFAYGSGGVTANAFFNLRVFSLVDRGFVYAIAHVRGGSEMGPQWYDDAKLLRRRNTFTDFIDVAGTLTRP